MGRDPETDAEWKEAAAAAAFSLALDSAVQYGLVLVLVGGKKESGINLARCEWILEEARKRGIEPPEEENFNQ